MTTGGEQLAAPPPAAAAVVPSTSMHPPEDGTQLFDGVGRPEHQQEVVLVVRPGRTLFVRFVSIGRSAVGPPQRRSSSDREGDPRNDNGKNLAYTRPPPSSEESNGSHLPPPPEPTSSSSAEDVVRSDVTFVFVHGLCSTEQHYHLLLDELHGAFSAKGGSATCVLYDMAGCGQSPQPQVDPSANGGKDYWAPYSYDHSQADLVAVLRRVQSSKSSPGQQPVVPPPLIVVGHSYAANLLLPLVWPIQQLPLPLNTTKGDRVPPVDVPTVRAMILMSCGIRTPSLPHPDGGATLLRYGPIPLLQWLQSRLTQGFVTASLHPDAPSNVVEIVTKHCNANDMAVVKAYHRATMWVSLLGSEEEEDEATTSNESAAVTKSPPSFLPTLVLHGASDVIIPPAAGHELAQILNTQVHVVENAGHMVALEQPRAVATAIVDFLQRDGLRLL